MQTLPPKQHHSTIPNQTQDFLSLVNSVILKTELVKNPIVSEAKDSEKPNKVIFKAKSVPLEAPCLPKDRSFDRTALSEAVSLVSKLDSNLPASRFRIDLNKDSPPVTKTEDSAEPVTPDSLKSLSLTGSLASDKNGLFAAESPRTPASSVSSSEGAGKGLMHHDDANPTGNGPTCRTCSTNMGCAAVDLNTHVGARKDARQTYTVVGTHKCVNTFPTMKLPWMPVPGKVARKHVYIKTPISSEDSVVFLGQPDIRHNSRLSFFTSNPAVVEEKIKIAPPQSVWGKKKLFSELLKDDVASVNGARPPPITTAGTQSSSKSNSPSRSSPTKNKRGNEIILSFSDILKKFDANAQMKKMPTSPRGLINSGNMCYNNAILQMLAECPPFYNMIMEIGQTVPNAGQDAPLIESLVAFFQQLEISKPNSTKQTQTPLLCEQIFDVLRKSKKLDLMKGRQEDAEEFLGHILSHVDEEMVHVSKLAEKIELDSSVDVRSRPSSPEDASWLEVGPKNKVSVTRTLSTDDTPITRIFGGKIRSTVKAAGQKDSVTVEPFRSLQLDISVENVNSVEDAISNLANPEVIENYTVKNVQVQAQKQLLIEQLPPVVVLQLKRFKYTSAGGTEKISKNITFPESFTFPSKVMAKKCPPNEYTLSAVIHHHGPSDNTGHYTSRILNQTNEWLRYDDDVVTTAANDHEREDAYLLLYRKGGGVGPAPNFCPLKFERNHVWTKFHKHQKN